ncbi:MAG: DnaJ domain-containing protein [Candidatus Eremiobacterota bacterium]
MAQKRDFYLVLGIPPVSQPDEIKKAYRNLSKKYHPDLNPDMKTVSDEKMKELVEAYNTLNDVQKRKSYDAQPQFQVRRFAKGAARKIDKSAFSKKPEKPQSKSPVLRLLSKLFTKGGDDGAGKPDPKQADVHFMLGLSMSDNESFLPQAKSEFQLAIKYDASHKEANYNLALMCYKLGQFEEARVQFQKVLQVEPNDQYARKMIQLLQDDSF